MKKLLLMATALLFACTADLFAQTIYMEGAGTKESPYLIRDERDFKEVFTAEYYNDRDNPGNYLYYRQEADLNLNAINANGSIDPWVIKWFAGNYDGNGHSITYSITVDLATCRQTNIGLFGLLTKSAVVKNLRICNSQIVLKYESPEGSVESGKYIGMIAGGMGRKLGIPDNGTNYNMRIANCRIENSTIDASQLNGHLRAYEFYFGGVVGLMQAGTLHEVAFTDDTPRGDGYTLQGFSIVGGIVGRMMPTWDNITMDKTPRTIENCLFRGSILSERAKKPDNTEYTWSGAGGIVGRVEGNNLANDKITNCYVDASKIMTHSGYTGGLSAGVAVLSASFNVYHCFADVGSFEVGGTFYPITAKKKATIDAKSQYSGACVTTQQGIKYYHTGALGSVPRLSNYSTTINSMTNSEKISTYLGDAFIEHNNKIALRSTIKGYIYSDKDGDFHDPETWQNYPDSWGENIAVTPTDAQWSEVLGIEIKHKVTLGNDFSGQIGTAERKVPIKIIDNNERAALIVTNENVSLANATIKVEEGGSFVNTTNSDVQGVIEKRLHGGIWNFIGLSGYENLAPLRNRLLRENQSENTGNTGNEILKFWALGYDYEQSKWDEDNYLYWEDNIAPGAGILVYTNGDNILVEIGQNRDENGIETGVNNFENAQTVSHTFQNSGPWVALANPYPAVMDARKLMNEIGTQNIQGQGIYVREAKSYDWTFVTTEENNKQINAAQGFFVKFSVEQEQDRTITLSKTMLVDYPTTENNTSKVAASGAGEFLRVSVASEGYRVPVMYRQNDAASAEYDIFDADKLFGSGTVAEPYFALGERMLCKQEADSTHFVADLNIRSEQSRSVEIIAEYIPEGYTLSLIDDNNETEMNQDDVYTADIARGDNEGRFKLVINKNNVSIEDVANVEEINFYNNNRQITISGGNIKLVQVYNTLGQKVYETKQRTFTLDEVASGTYIVNVQTDETSFSNKIVVH
ncbi:MAG: T9SS type A sorting domain-containing protein [Bacteroidales bacterium]|nr:T9SS type A sorting domain-containing protein [Bacteroidales bacterium]MDD5976451.1 T9SS type A sorting domain-containing protein [Bacteroidales bacterium]